jgi:Icc-related predicted phosphoesterase
VKLLIIADDEFLGPKFPDCNADLLVSCGDLPENIIVETAKRCRCREILAVKGNRDSWAFFPPPIRDLHLNRFQFRGLTFGGFCGSWKFKPGGNYLFKDSEVERQLKNFPPVDVFVTHNSPLLVHDREDDAHFGFAAFRHYLQRAKPKFMLHGHQHQNVESIIGGTHVIGVYGHRMLVIPD